MKKIQKGSIIYEFGWWFVVVNQRGETIGCICDHANNVHFINVSDIKYKATPKEAMRAHGWNAGDEKLLELSRERDIPVEVIAEVLSGCHDERFEVKS